MTAWQPADQQQRDAALDPTRSVIVQAPAGSGKTGLLTQRFLRLLATVANPEEIIAITFTRKAAAEMRDRILDAIGKARSEDIPDGGNRQLTHRLAQDVLRRDAELDWKLLENPARLRIMTIDSFNAMLTRQMPVSSAFGQQPGIVDDGMAICREAAHQVLLQAETDDQPGPALRVLLAHLDNRLADARELLALMLTQRDLWLRHLDLHGLDRERLEANLAVEVTTILSALLAELPDGLIERLHAVIVRSAEYLQAAEAVNDKTDWLPGLAAMEIPVADAGHLETWKLVSRFLLTNDGNLRKPGGLNINLGFPPKSARFLEAGQAETHKQSMGELLAELENRPIAVSLLARVADLPVPHYTDDQWRVLDAINTLLPHAVLALQERFRDSGEVDFAELAIRARHALGDDDAPTDLALRLDYRLRHLLVDEFQDTSHSQIDLLLRLTRGWEPEDGRTVFMVGDPMQSIYAFREAEVGHFLAVRDYGLGTIPAEPLRLSANFRSEAGIVDWVNDVFGGDDGRSGIFPASDKPTLGAIAYEPSEASHAALPGMAVEVHAFEQEGHDAEADRVIELVRAGLADPDNRSTAILVRGRRHLASILPALRAAEIPFRAVELETLESQAEIQDLLALTRAIVNPVDDTALYSVLRAPWCGLSLAGLFRLSATDGESWLNLRDETWQESLDKGAGERVARVASALTSAWSMRGRRSLRERVEGAWLAMGGPAILDAADALENANLFFELLQQLESAGELDDVNALDERLTKLHASPDPAADDSVQLMTLHKAKGLQFGTVIIPALDQRSSQQDRLLFHWMERPGLDGEDRVLLGPLRSRIDEEGGAIYRFIERLKKEKSAYELARLLYVGVTRAERKVHLLGKARFTRQQDVAVLARPLSGSLLELLWEIPAVRMAFEAVPVPTDDAVHPEIPSPELDLRRITDQWTLPAFPTGPHVPLRDTATASDNEIIYDWAGDRVRHTGTLVHRMLQRIAENGLQDWDTAALDEWPLENRLRAMGLPEAECGPAAGDARAALRAALGSERGRWILDAHEAARNEWSLAGIDEGERVAVSIDRSFVDSDGVRWIIDYKTSTHEGGQLDEFLDNQQERYRKQLERYARLVSRLDDRPVRLGLYFPLQDAFRDWAPGESADP